jgi:hypothetical protein
MDRRSSRRANSESRAVTQENNGGRSWGIGLGFVLGIILAILSLSQLPFLVGHGLISRNAAGGASAAISDRLGGPRLEPLRQSLPGRQIPDDQALPEWQQTLANRSNSSDDAAKLTGAVTLENAQPSSTATSPLVPA